MIERFMATRDVYNLERERTPEGRSIIRNTSYGAISSESFEVFDPRYHLYRDCPALATTSIAELEDGWRPYEAKRCSDCEQRAGEDVRTVVAANAGDQDCIFLSPEDAADFPAMAIGDQEHHSVSPGDPTWLELLTDITYEPVRLTLIQLDELGEWEG